MIAAVDNVIGIFLVVSFAVFGLTLIVTKSKIFGCKREFVEKQYQASLVANIHPWYIRWIHKWWHAMWTCPMCLGTWISAAAVIYQPICGHWVIDWLAVLGANWVIHCFENWLFNIAQYFEKTELEENSENIQKK